MRLVMDRFAARVSSEYGDDVILKGGVVLELRLAAARATKDLDLRLVGNPEHSLVRLQQAGRMVLGDHLSFLVQPDPRHPTIHAEGMQYEGLRFRVQARLSGKDYGGPFGLDAAFDEPWVGEPELLRGSDFLDFVGVDPPLLRVYPLEAHIAEKLHAYTMPRARPNSRVKDLPDIALLGRVRPIDAKTLRKAIVSTFAHRSVQLVPEAVPSPAESWREPYKRMALRDQLPWPDIESLTETVRDFLDPLLRGGGGVWSPDHWGWKEER